MPRRYGGIRTTEKTKTAHGIGLLIPENGRKGQVALSSAMAIVQQSPKNGHHTTASRQLPTLVPIAAKRGNGDEEGDKDTSDRNVYGLWLACAPIPYDAW